LFFEPIERGTCVACGPAFAFGFPLFVPERLESIRRSRLSNLLLLLAMYSRVNILLQQLSRLITSIACFGRADLRIYSKGEQLLLAGESVFETLILSAVRFNEQVKPAIVAKFVGRCLTLAIADL
jgi:hypothetical protein